MSNLEILEAYYRYANAGDWDAWCDLFHADYVMDEQLAGRITGLETLKSIMSGFPTAYAKFENKPRTLFVSGDEGAAVSHISALASKHLDEPIEADAMNYFKFQDGKIIYMQNFHDSKPFDPFLRQLRGE